MLIPSPALPKKRLIDLVEKDRYPGVIGKSRRWRSINWTQCWEFLWWNRQDEIYQLLDDASWWRRYGRSSWHPSQYTIIWKTCASCNYLKTIWAAVYCVIWCQFEQVLGLERLHNWFRIVPQDRKIYAICRRLIKKWTRYLLIVGWTSINISWGHLRGCQQCGWGNLVDEKSLG